MSTKTTTTTECEENIDSVPNDKILTVTNEVQGYKEMTDITDEMSTLPPVKTTQQITSNESSFDQLHSTLTSSDQSLPKIITISSINDLQMNVLK